MYVDLSDWKECLTAASGPSTVETETLSDRLNPRD